MEEDDLRPVDVLVKSKIDEPIEKMNRKKRFLQILKSHPDGLSGSELILKAGSPNNGSAYMDLKMLESQGLITIGECQCHQSKIYKLK